ncbi:MAG: autotransporter domain-containing protein [Desulfobaccales bacterium]
MSWKGVQSCKIGRIIFRAVTYLLIITLGVSYSSAHAQTLTPALVFSTYLGGTAGSNPLTFAQNVACDALGNIYVTGATQATNLPVLNAYQPTPAAGSTESAFVAKYNSAGQLLWCTYLGGNNQSMGIGVAAMPDGGVAVVGLTTSNASFPITSNAFQSKNNGQSDYFVTVFNAQGKLEYSTYLGGSGVEGAVGATGFTDDSNPGNCIAVDASGRIYVGGITTSGGGSGQTKFPLTSNAYQKNLAGSTNASLSIIDPNQSGGASLVYSSFLGGDHDSQGHSVAVDPSGQYIAVGGFTTSLNFPTTSNAYRSTAPPGGFGPNSSNGFITEFQSTQPGSPSSTYSMRYSTYLGANSSTARDDVYGMTMTPSGLIVATGRTQSAGFPMTTGGPTIFNSAPYLQEGVSGDEPYVVKINPALNGTASLVYSTFLGGGCKSGKWGSWSTSVAVDARGAVYVAGETGPNTQGAPYVPSNLTAPQKFPFTPNAFQKAPQGSEDALLMQINPSGDSLGYSTYLGGTLSDRTYGLAVDPDGNVVMTGLTFSSDFPLQNAAQNYPGNNGYQNAFVTEFSPLYTPNNLITDYGATYTVTGDITYDNDYIGQNSTGALIQGDFTNTVNNNLELGQNAGASGSYNLSGGSLSVAGNEYVGYSGTGAFTQTGGTHTVTGILMLGANAGSSGTYSLSGGSLTVGDYEAVGFCGTGSFTQSGGTHTVTALYLGTEAGASGSYTLSDSGSGSLLSVTGNEFIGYSGAGTFTQTGGSNTVGSNFFVGTQGGTGSYSLSGGSLTVSGDLYLGNSAGASGSYNLSGGSLSVGGNEYVGNSGTGTFTQTGGSHTVTGTLSIADQSGSSGTYNLQGGSLTAPTFQVNSSGIFNYSGGTFTGRLVNYGTVNFNADFTASDGLANYSATPLSINAGRTVTLNGSGLDNEATLVVNGTLAGIGPLVNNTTGTLSGTGTIQGNLTNQGTLSPGNSPGTLTINGNYTQTAAGTLLEQIASASSYSKLAVSGTASLAGAVAPVLLGGYRPKAFTVFPDIITTTGGLTGTFSSVTQPAGPTLIWQPYYDNSSFGLTVQRDYANQWLGLNSNQQQVGLMLNSVAATTTGDLGAVLTAIDALPANSDVQNAYKQISPEKAGALANLGFVAATFQMRNLATRTTNLRLVQGESGGGGGLASGGLSCNYSKLDGVMLAYNGASLSNLFSARKELQAPEGHWGLYMDGGAAFGSQTSSLNQTGYNFTLGGFTAGADYRLRDNLLVGLATGYSNTSAGFYGSGGSVNTNTIPFNAYAAYFPGSLYAYGSLGYALNLFDLKRGISFGDISRTASSSSTGNQFNLYGETGYDVRMSRFILTPSATLAYSALWLGGFTEQDAGSLNLKIASQTADSLQTGIGGRLTVPLQAGSVKVVPQGYAFYQHEFANGSRNLNASLSQGSSTFNFQTDATKRNYALVGASITAGLRKNLYAQVNFNAEVGRTGSTGQAINAGLRWEF